MMHKFLAVLAIAGGCLSINSALAQSSGNAPYSRFGLGEVNTSTGNIRNFGMGGTGVSSPNSLLINTQNPALLYYNNNVIFEMSVAGQLKTLKDISGEQRDGDVSLNAITLAIPVSKRWTAALGLKPFSHVEYETTARAAVIGDPNTQVIDQYRGEGGLSQFWFGSGVKVAKDLTLGVEAGYLFGNIDTYYTTELDKPNALPKQLRQRTDYRNFIFKTGLGYRLKAGEKRYIALGGTYDFAADLNAERSVLLEQLISGSVSQETFSDTTTGKVSLPSGFQAGISFDNATNWSINLDVAAKNWSKFRDYDGAGIFQNSLRVGLGSEFVPEPTSTRYIRRVTYRAGLSYMKTPYLFGGKEVNDMAVTWGFTFPVGRAMATESYFINLGFAAGKRGSLEVPLVQETYLKVQAGLTINNKWFIKRQLD